MLCPSTGGIWLPKHQQSDSFWKTPRASDSHHQGCCQPGSQDKVGRGCSAPGGSWAGIETGSAQPLGHRCLGTVNTVCVLCGGSAPFILYFIDNVIEVVSLKS